MRSLVELCTLCGLCPCPKIAADLMEAKSRYIDREGLSLAVRILTDVPRLARLCETFPKLINALTSNKAVGFLLRKVAHIHPKRQLIKIPEQNFFQWTAQKGLTSRRDNSHNVAYFAGCSAGYLFPQIGQATVEVLEHNGVNVYVPPQECCGMPHLVEGDRNTTLRRVQANMGNLLESLQAGDDLVCSCPTCGYLMKVLLKERAYYSEAYQRSVNAGEDELKVPKSPQGRTRFKVLKKSMYKDILTDDGYFSSLDPMNRIDLAEHLFDAGEYLARLHSDGRLDTRFAHIPERMVYFAPCHQREQKIGSPYPDLLTLIPGITIERVEGMYCCGMGGNFGYKTGFHEKSLELGSSLMDKIRELAPQSIITDCMSCRLQFNHALPYPVFHPMEILARGYLNRRNSLSRTDSGE
ncbi:heterodisulfide reductase-related iron-sulfur binding cluster [Geobacter sp. OR-1]|uniref:heterodisulfide reductase-related iron-sulfur binding cluster n=1 Tax=Geobacter sp. OR-1 TaxID=1266765 RepID=UPI001ED9BF4F|nr:heterodisulfide reductase-related iron-sulfur binding cluster [Geobacter sp. OR-1]